MVGMALPQSIRSRYYNSSRHPHDVRDQDGPEPFGVVVREVTGDEKAQWWERAVAAYPPYEECPGEDRTTDTGWDRFAGVDPSLRHGLHVISWSPDVRTVAVHPRRDHQTVLSSIM